MVECDVEDILFGEGVLDLVEQIDEGLLAEILEADLLLVEEDVDLVDLDLCRSVFLFDEFAGLLVVGVGFVDAALVGAEGVLPRVALIAVLVSALVFVFVERSHFLLGHTYSIIMETNIRFRL